MFYCLTLYNVLKIVGAEDVCSLVGRVLALIVYIKPHKTDVVHIYRSLRSSRSSSTTGEFKTNQSYLRYCLMQTIKTKVKIVIKIKNEVQWFIPFISVQGNLMLEDFQFQSSLLSVSDILSQNKQLPKHKFYQILKSPL